MRKLVFTILKTIIGIAAFVNLVALFVFQYKTPSWLGGSGDAEDAPFVTEAEEETDGIYLDVPSGPINYSGSGALSLLDGLYALNADGTVAEGVEIETTISEGTSRREKVVTYTAHTPSGNVLTAERMLYLGNRYTGPSISILGNMPFCYEGEAAEYADLLRENELVSADDGFGNDITDDITTSLKSYDASTEEAVITISAANQFGDVFATDVSVSMNRTGVVLTLVTDAVTITQGESFDGTDYVKDCFDADGYSLFKSISEDGDVDTDTPGEYVLTLYCRDGDGVYSIERTLTVTVEPAPEEEETADEE